MNELTVSLVQNIRCVSVDRPIEEKKFFKKIVTAKSPTVISANSNESWSRSIQIPPLVPSSNGACKIIDISYELVLNVNPMGLSLSKNLSIPIVIVTTPMLDRSISTLDLFQSPQFFQTCVFGNRIMNI